MNLELMSPRELIITIIDRIYRGGMTTTSGGNISIIDDNNDIWVTPSAVDKGSLRASDIICVKADGETTGRHKPSSELPFHKAIYKKRPDIKAIIHAHSPALVAFSIARQIPDTNVISQAKHVCGSIGYAPYELPGSEALGLEIASAFSNDHAAVIMENHGVVVGGNSLINAFERFETLEFCARTLIHGKMIGEPRYLEDAQIAAFERQIPHDFPINNEVEHSSNEKEIRREICRIVKRACDQGLMISTYGTVSKRWNGNDFLITPTNVSRWNLDLGDIVQIRNGKKEPGKIPSRSVMLHQEIYRRNPGINSIILTQPPYLMAFSITDLKLEVRTIPESWIFLQDVPKVPFGSQFADHDVIPELVSKNIPSVIIENDSVLVTGDALLQTFDRLEVAEFSAKSLVLGKSLGEMVPINDEQVAALKEKFLS